MLKGKQIKEVKTGYVTVVPFCEDCGSQDIKIVKTCKNCHSHNIKTDYLDKRSTKMETTLKDVYVYECDRCHKEFECFECSNIISYSNGEFNIGKSEYNEREYFIKEDLCNDCLKHIINQLNESIQDIISPDNVNNVAQNILNERS